MDSVDSICLFMYYSSWIGDGLSPLAINAYLMDKQTFRYSSSYATDLTIDDYCSRTKPVLTNHRIVVASEMLDSIANSDGTYVPMLRMRLNDDFTSYFASIQSFESQEKFNDLFNGLFIETSFGSSTVLNISDIALGVYYRFGYRKAGRDTVVHDMKIFYANSEVRTVNRLEYPDKKVWINALQQKTDSFNYIIAPAGVYTRMTFPMARMADSIEAKLGTKRPYVNLAQVQVDVTNVFSGTEAQKQRNDWLQPADYMLLIKEESMQRFFENRELPSDTCALLSALTQGTDSAGNTTYYYSYDLSDFLTNQLRKEVSTEELNMMLVPVSVSTGTYTSSSSSITAVRQQQTISATVIRSAQNGMNLKLVYSGF